MTIKQALKEIQAIEPGSFVVIYSDYPEEIKMHKRTMKIWKEKGLCGGWILPTRAKLETFNKEKLMRMGLLYVGKPKDISDAGPEPVEIDQKEVSFFGKKDEK